MGNVLSGFLALMGPSSVRGHRPPNGFRGLPGILGITAAAGIFTHAVLPRVLGTWGATGSESTMSLPGDGLIPEPDEVQTMAVTISAPPDEVWPWLVQMGVDRAGLYSYTWVENGLLHLGVTNADRINPGWQDLKVGDVIAFTPEGYPGGRAGPRVVELESGRHLVLDSSPGAPPGTVTGTWQLVLHSSGARGTRLLLRTRSGPGRPPALRVMDFLLRPGYLVMDRAMLLGIKKRAEGNAHIRGRPGVSS
ncbi:hypothetical protein FBY30_0622 [Arthrobacter sp. SLBN-83]|nr:hypothetical protein FBY30_0622 [Arthrobacter sp. SLBN-83]